MKRVSGQRSTWDTLSGMRWRRALGTSCAMARRFRSEWSLRREMSERLGIAQPGLAEKIAAALQGLGLPVAAPPGTGLGDDLAGDAGGIKSVRAGRCALHCRCTLEKYKWGSKYLMSI